MNTDRWLGNLLFISSFALLGGLVGSCTDDAPNIGANRQALGEDGGDGSAPSSDGGSGYVLIDSCAELEAVSNAPTLNYRLTADIDCTGFESGGDGFTPIMNFAGVFDGNAHVVSGLRVSQTHANGGLFGRIQGGSVLRLGLLGAVIEGNTQAGCLAGFAQFATVREVFCRDTSVSSKRHVGSLVGHATNTTITDSYAHASVGCKGKQCGLLLGQAKQGSWVHGYGVIQSDIAPSRVGIENHFDWQTVFFDCDLTGGCSEAGAQRTANLQSETFLVSQGWDFSSTWGMSTDFGYACLLWEPGCGAACASEDSSCNGQDDDCDGNVDEDFAQNETLCGVGACTANGVLSCSNGALSDSCAPGSPSGSDSMCDLIDDDCDGEADEDYQSQTTSCGQGSCGADGQTSCVDGVVEDSCEPGTPAANDSTCDGLDNDCDGNTDEAYVSESTTCGEGVCSASGSTSCVAGQVEDSCTPSSPSSDDAVCDGVDDDCDGALDEHYIVTSTSCGLGVCASTGTLSCIEGVESDDCAALLPTAETDSTDDGVDDDCDGAVDEDATIGDANCDRIDDDADGRVDEGYGERVVRCGVGACESEVPTECVNGVPIPYCYPGTPIGPDSTCDGVDDDCDGSVDEMAAQGSDDSCDFVDNDCDGAVDEHATLEADTQCDEVDNDCDGNIDEDVVPAVDDATCDGYDDDCDGSVDEDVDSGDVDATCDFVDDDCDGSIDEDVVFGVGQGPDDNCDNVDDDCDYFFDESFYGISTCGVGVCERTGATSCLNGKEVEIYCQPGPQVGSDNDCNGFDDDCDGAVDESFVSIATSCGQGVCQASGSTSCNAGVVTDSCTPGPQTGDDSDCDGVDDNCNGVADESFVSIPSFCGTGACSANGEIVCSSGDIVDTCAPGVPAVNDSLCNGVDDDCNGVVDEDYVPSTTSCGVGACMSNGSTQCVLGAVVDDCNPDVPAPVDSTCDSIDDDCDGTSDEDYAPQTVSCGIGACGAIGTLECEVGALVDTCTPVSPLGSDSTCDGYDDDCDGTVDESCEGVPTDLSLVAPPLPDNQITPFSDMVSYLYEATPRVQRDADIAAFEERRMGAVFGYVFDRAGAPVPDVRVAVKGHPEFGWTLTRADGRFDLALNAGGTLLVEYAHPGYLRAVRTVDTEWGAYLKAPDLVVTEESATVSPVDLGSPGYQVAQGDLVTDADGSRTAVVIVPPQTSATAFVDGDTSVPLSGTVSVRVTEYTAGETGPDAMPAPLPFESGYTYAAAFTVDEAEALGAKRVDFSSPLPFYVDNFLGLPGGAPVPLGYFDHELGRWQGVEGGRVLKILSLTTELTPRVLIDVNDDGVADAEGTTGVSQAEAEVLATLYAPGDELIRVELPHFTDYDANLGIGSPDDAEFPASEDDKLQSVEPDPDELSCGSVIGCTRRTLGESLPVSGSGSSLVYQSERMRFAGERFSIDIPIAKAPLPASVKTVFAELNVAGVAFRARREAVDVSTGDVVTFDWDGRDIAGREVQGTQLAGVTVRYCYEAQYTDSPTFGGNTGQLISFLPGGSREELCLASRWTAKIGGTYYSPNVGVAGWDLSEHHYYDTSEGILWLGSGQKRRVAKYGGMTLLHTIPAAESPPTMQDVGPDGSLYMLEMQPNPFPRKLLRYRESEGIQVLWDGAGRPALGNIADGSLLADADFALLHSATVDREGRLILADEGTIYRVERDGRVYRMAGGGTVIPTPEGVSALDANFGAVVRIVHDRANGVTFVPTSNGYLYRISAEGLATRHAGNGSTNCLIFPNEGEPALQQPFCGGVLGRIVDVDSRGQFVQAYGGTLSWVDNLGKIGAFRFTTSGGEFASFFDELEFLPDNSFVWARRESTDFDGSPISWGVFRTDFSGETTRIMGEGSNPGDGDGAAATAFDIGQDRAGLTRPKFQVLPNGDMYLLRDRIGISTELYLVHNDVTPVVPSEDGSLVYTFDEAGLHQQTLDADTGVVLRSFEYDAAGRLVRSIDREGLATTIERDASGTPFALTAPYGQQTSLTTNLDGYLSSVSNALSESYLLEYDGAQPGALSKMSDPLMREHNYTFVDGYLSLDEDPAGGSTALSLTELGPTRRLIEKTTALGRTTEYDLDTLADGASQRNMTDPAGFTTQQTSDQSAGSSVTLPDGTVSSSIGASDPRFGMSAPFTAESRTVLPSGLTRSVTSTREAVLSDPSDPLSVVSVTHTSSVGTDAPSSSLFDAATSSYTSLSPEGRSSITELDSLGRVSRVSVPGIAPVSYTYDADGRIETVTQTSATDGTRTTTYAYDVYGFLQSVTAPSLRQTSYTYDAVGRPLTTTLPDTETLSTTWDAMDNLKSITPPGKTAHLFSYTDRDQVEAYEPPDAGTATGASGQSYDLDRAPRISTLMDGRSVDVAYDTAGRVDAVTVARGSYGFVYSAGDGKLSYTSNPEGDTVSFFYNGPLVTEVAWSEIDGGSDKRVSFDYDDHFRMTGVELGLEPTQTVASRVDYLYDQDGYITEVIPVGSADGMTVTRDALNALLTGTSTTDSGSGNSVGTSRTHNDFGEATSMSATYQGGDFGLVFSYDADGRIDARQETSGASSTAQSYEYDLRGRLTDVYVDSVLTYEYDYDENGNRVAYTGPEGTVSATYDAQDRLLTYGGNTYTYNDHGQLTSKRNGSFVTTYNYDELGNLLSVTLPDSTLIEYVIDALGRRVGKKVDGTLVRQWTYQDQLNPVAEYDGSGNLIQQFVYATRMNVPDLIIRGGTTYRVIADQVGSVRRIVEVSTGAIAHELTYSPFGKVLSDSSPGWQPFAYAGGLYDQQTKLVRFGARDYDAEAGRWTAKDPIGLGPASNLYLYGEADPVNFVDRNGLYLESAIDLASLAVGLDTLAEEGVGEYGVNLLGVIADGAALALPAVPGGVSILIKGGKVAKGSGKASKLQKSGSASCDAVKKIADLPALDATGKVHGKLPRPKDLGNYNVDELGRLRDDLATSVQERIRKNIEKGHHKGHAQRQAAEQDLIGSIEKHLGNR